MSVKNAIVGTTTALAIIAGSVALPNTASATPFHNFNTAQIETEATGVEAVGRRRGRRYDPGAAAAIGALAVGAAIFAGAAAQAAPRRCRIVRTERWSNRYQAYVIRSREVCD